MSTVLGETSLATLLKTLTVKIHPSKFAFLSLPAGLTTTLHLGPSRQRIIMLFFEPGEKRHTAIVDTMQLENKEEDTTDIKSSGCGYLTSKVENAYAGCAIVTGGRWIYRGHLESFSKRKHFL